MREKEEKLQEKGKGMKREKLHNREMRGERSKR